MWLSSIDQLYYTNRGLYPRTFPQWIGSVHQDPKERPTCGAYALYRLCPYASTYNNHSNQPSFLNINLFDQYLTMCGLEIGTSTSLSSLIVSQSSFAMRNATQKWTQFQSQCQLLTGMFLWMVMRSLPRQRSGPPSAKAKNWVRVVCSPAISLTQSTQNLFILSSLRADWQKLATIISILRQPPTLQNSVGISQTEIQNYYINSAYSLDIIFCPHSNNQKNTILYSTDSLIAQSHYVLIFKEIMSQKQFQRDKEKFQHFKAKLFEQPN